jgi:hypothetical protein
VIGGSWEDEPELWSQDEVPRYLDRHPVGVCFWCKPELGYEAGDSKASVDRALAEAGRESIAWRWRTRGEPDR